MATGEGRVIEGITGVRFAVSADGWVASDSSDGIRVWDLASGTSKLLTGHRIQPYSLAVTADGRLVSGSYDGTVRVWDVASGESRVLDGLGSIVISVAALPDGRVVAGSPEALRVWDVESGEGRTFGDHVGWVTSLAGLADRRVVSGARDWRVIVWDSDRGAQITDFFGDAPVTHCVAAGQHRIVVGSANGAVHVLELRYPEPSRA